MAIKTIIISGDPQLEELIAAAAITPGMLVERDSSGKAAVHSTAGATAKRSFALENDLEGEGITDAYAADDRVRVGHFRSGDRVYALLANGENAATNDFLESNGDGYLRVVDADASAGEIGVQSIVAQAQEAVDLSGSSGADPSTYRIKVRIV